MNTHKIFVPTVFTLMLIAFVFSLTLPAFAERGSSRNNNAPHASSTLNVMKVRTASTTKAVNLTCMQTAVDAREDALNTAFATFHDAVDTALVERKTALHDAWGLTDKSARLKAVKSAREEFRKSNGTALKALKKARESAWGTFKTTAKTSCKETLPKGDDAVEKETAGSIAI